MVVLLTGRSRHALGPPPARPRPANVDTRSRTAISGHIVFGSNNFRSPTTCACLCTSVCRFQHPEQPAMVTRRRAPARYMFTLPECSKLVWGQALAQGQISAVDRGWCLRGAATAALPRPIYRITCPSRARLSRSFPGPRQASWLDVPDNRPLSGRFTGRSLFREQNNSQRMGFSRGNPSAPGYGERADDRGARSPGPVALPRPPLALLGRRCHVCASDHPRCLPAGAEQQSGSGHRVLRVDLIRPACMLPACGS